MNTAQENDRLKWALDFVKGRIHEQSQLLAEPLDEEDEVTLANLPDDYRVPEYSLETGPGPLIAPERTHEKLVGLANSAIDSDRLNIPAGILHWELADIILRLNDHRMAWLIERAGIQSKYRKPRWDGWLLVFAAIVLLVVTYGSAFLAHLLGFHNESVLIWVGAATFAVVCVVLHFVLKRFEKSLWNHRIRELTEQLGIPIH